MTTTLKRSLLFAGDEYYPGGGWEDFIGSFDSVAEAKKNKSNSVPGVPNSFD